MLDPGTNIKRTISTIYDIIEFAVFLSLLSAGAVKLSIEQRARLK